MEGRCWLSSLPGGFARHEAVNLDFGQIQHGENTGAIVDLKGKARTPTLLVTSPSTFSHTPANDS